VHFTGYVICNDRSIDACLALASLAADRGIPRSVDVSSASIVGAWGSVRFADALDAIAPDVVKANEDELQLLPADLPTRGTWVVATAGAGATRVFAADGSITTWDVEPIGVVDTTGGGDAFVAGFLAAWDADASSGESVVAGHVSAARVVTGPGADWWEDDPHADE
jgi:sugar/nucleoside kinase (ribokinase family)